MKVYELFSGNGDITKTLKENNINAVSIDYDSKKNPDICKDVYKMSKKDFKDVCFIWASPDCTTYSFASHGLHRIKGQIPVSQYAKECDINNEKFIALLKELNIPFIIENPRAHFRHMGFVKGLYRVTVYYSTYGMEYAKPTDLFSNVDISKYFNQTITKGNKPLDYVCSSYKDFLGRCRIPKKLIEDIVKCVKELKL